MPSRDADDVARTVTNLEVLERGRSAIKRRGERGRRRRRSIEPDGLDTVSGQPNNELFGAAAICDHGCLRRQPSVVNKREKVGGSKNPREAHEQSQYEQSAHSSVPTKGLSFRRARRPRG